MSITVTFGLRDGVVLPRELGERLAGRAFTLVQRLAPIFGWAYLGAVDTRGAPRQCVWTPPPMHGHAWRVDGRARFTLALVEGSGQLAETFVRTSDADDPCTAHRAVLAVLARLNAEIYDGRLAIHDETGYAETGDDAALASSFEANARLAGAVRGTLAIHGWHINECPYPEAGVLVPYGGASIAVEDVLEAEIIEDGDEAREQEQRGAESWTPFERFLRVHGIKPAHVARESGYSRQFLLHLRMGRILPTPACIARIIAALRRLTRERIEAAQVFDRSRGTSGHELASPRRALPPPHEGGDT